MRKRYNIKWSEKDKNKLKNSVRRFNYKIDKLIKNGVDANYLPDKVKVKDIKKLINTRNEYNLKINQLNRFLRKGAEDIIESENKIKTTKYAINESVIMKRSINIERKKERERISEIEITDRGKKTGFKRGEVVNDRMDENRPKTAKFENIKNQTNWNKFYKNLEREYMERNNARKELYKNNYIKSLRENYGRKANKLIKTIENLPAEYVVDMYYKEEQAKISFNYENLDQNARLDTITEIWNNATFAYNSRF